MSGFLEEMARASRERVRQARHACSEARMLDDATTSPRPLPLYHVAGGFDLIAELKLRSPAIGQLKSSGEHVGARVRAYARAGAAAVSVLTEPSRFDGSLLHLAEAVRALTPLGVPVMRKDFLVDPYQVMEARLAGASGVLAILRMVSRETLEELLDCAKGLGLFVLLEAFDEGDIGLMHALIEARKGVGVVFAGVNCRDLSTLQVVPGRLIELAPLLPALPRVAESGVLSAADAAAAATAGYELVLVGSALMQGDDPEPLAAAMLEAGRTARQHLPGAGLACG
jgi:indole-3-glycerol phosphate synthase